MEKPSPKKYVLTCESGHYEITPYAFARYAEHFLLAARVVPDDPSSPVPHYLVCRSIELAFKAYCLVKGDKQDDFKRNGGIGHSLVKALRAANNHGLQELVIGTPEELEELTRADKLYANKGFEYFTPEALKNLLAGGSSDPDVSRLAGYADKLIAGIKPVCHEKALE